jgi:ankyrin repeat protein
MNAAQKRFAAAIEKGDEATISALFKHKSVSVNSTLLINNRLKCLPLFVAAFHGQLSVARQLLDLGAKIDAHHDGAYDTPLHVSIRHRHTDVALFLIARGADVKFADRGSFLPLCNAVYSHSEQVAIALINAGAPLGPPHTLCHAAAISCNLIRLLIDRQVNVAELRDNDSSTPLHAFAGREFEAQGHRAHVGEMLLSVGVDVNAHGYQGDTCLHTAVLYENPEAVVQFIEHGADVNALDDNGDSPLNTACAIKDLQCAMLLLAAGARACHRTGTHCRIGVLLVAVAGADFDALTRLSAKNNRPAPTIAQVDAARSRIAQTALNLVRKRAFQVCVGLHSLRLDALQMCEILMQACGPFAHAVPFHCWWNIATTAKHFFSQPRRSREGGPRMTARS